MPASLTHLLGCGHEVAHAMPPATLTPGEKSPPARIGPWADLLYLREGKSGSCLEQGAECLLN